MTTKINMTRVAVGAAFGDATHPDITLDFGATSVFILNEDGTAANYVEVSFDGTTVVGRLIPGTPTASLRFSQHVTKIWLKRGAGTPTAQVICEADLVSA